MRIGTRNVESIEQSVLVIGFCNTSGKFTNCTSENSENIQIFKHLQFAIEHHNDGSAMK